MLTAPKRTRVRKPICSSKPAAKEDVSDGATNCATEGVPNQEHSEEHSRIGKYKSQCESETPITGLFERTPLQDFETLPVISSFIDTYGLLQCQLDPFNEFIERGLHEVVNYFRVIEEGGVKIEFGEVIVEHPTVSKLSDKVIRKMTPMYCQEKGSTYLSDVYADITVTNTMGIPRLYRHVHIGSIPVMVMSNLCNLKEIAHDPVELARLHEDVNEKGGYFVVNGAAKVVACQRRSVCNKALVYDKKKQGLPFEFFATIRSALQDGYMSTESYVGYKSGLIYVTVPYIEGAGIPLGILFRALGVKSERMMVKLSLRNVRDQEALTLLVRSLEYSYECDSQNLALEYIGRRGKKWSTTKVDKEGDANNEKETEGGDKEDGDEKDEPVEKPPQPQSSRTPNLSRTTEAEAISYARYLLATEFLPHLGNTPDSFMKKMIFVGYMVNALIQTILGNRKPDDRDHTGKQRFATTGLLIKELWYCAMKGFKKDIVSHLKVKKDREHAAAVNIHAICKPQTIKNIMCAALSANMWSGKKKANGRSQPYERFNYAAGIANARKVVTPMNDDGGKVEKPRHINLSQMFKTCPSESPEGKKVGLVSGLSIACIISTGFPARDIIPFVVGSENADIVCPIEDIFIEDDLSYFFHETIVFVNGDIVGYTTHPNVVVERIRKLRRSGMFEVSASYNRHNQEVNIFTDAGRVMTPRLIVDPNSGKTKLESHHIREIVDGKWNDRPGGVWYTLLSEGYVEFLDPEEEETLLIAMYPSDLKEGNRFTHCELNPALMFGIGASLIPFPNHNQSPRNCYQAAMGKQAIGIPGVNYAFQSKNKVTALVSPQKPVVSSFVAGKIGYDTYPAGQNACVAIAQFKGFNVEDSIAMNRGSVQRGFMSIVEFIPFKASARSDKGETLEMPDSDECFNFRGDTSKLDPETGVVREGEIVEEGDILIGKTVTSNEREREYRGKPKQNVSVVYDSKIQGRVHFVSTTHDADGYPQIKVVIYRLRPPIEGDKFSARHGQKGTIGILCPPEDMPHTREGITPDLLVNPLAIPSRMTIGMLIEMLLGRLVCTGNGIFNVPAREFFNYESDEDDESDSDSDTNNARDKPKHQNPEDYDPEKHTLTGGTPGLKRSQIPEIQKLSNEFYAEGDSTPCRKDRNISDIVAALRALGVNEFCDEVMYCGVTGRPLRSLIFFGLCYYQRLKHMVLDKIHARARGGHTGLTRQPREGRKAGGGFRIGCMESEVLLAHGGSWFVKDRLMEQSDETKMWYCKKCGMQATVCTPEHAGGSLSLYECRICESYNVALVKLPYATKLLIQEFMGMNVIMRIITSGAGEIGDDAYIYHDGSIVGKGMVLKSVDVY